MTLRHSTASIHSPQPFAARLALAWRAGLAWLMAALRLRRASNVVMAGRNDGPPDLDELWRDFNRRLGGLFGNKGGGRREEPEGGPSFQPDMKSAGIGVGLIALVVVLVWAGSGFFIVQEGQQAVVSTFGKYSYTSDAGFQWRFPYPFQSHETVPVTQLRSKEIGRNNVVQATGLRDSSMLTQDENIVDIRFTVQYRLKDARAYLFENRDPDSAVEQAAESAVREIVGRSKVDSVLVRAARGAVDRPGEVGAGADRSPRHRHPDRQRQRAERAGARAGAGGVQRCGEGRRRPRPAEERRPGLLERRGAQGARHSRPLARRSRRLPPARDRAGRRRCAALPLGARPSTSARPRSRATGCTSRRCSRCIPTSARSWSTAASGSNLLYLPLDRLLQQSRHRRARRDRHAA